MGYCILIEIKRLLLLNSQLNLDTPRWRCVKNKSISTFWGKKWMRVGFPGSSAGKESACNAGDLGSIPGLGRSPGEGNGYPLQYSWLENPHGQRSLAGYSPWGHKKSDTAEQLSTQGFLPRLSPEGHPEIPDFSLDLTLYVTGGETEKRPPQGTL